MIELLTGFGVCLGTAGIMLGLIIFISAILDKIEEYEKADRGDYEE